jgi:hypothetical protein
MNTWTPLWSGVVESSLWSEEDNVVKIFLTMLALKDSDHICRFNAFAIGKKANKTEKETLDAIKVLSSPDLKRIEKQPYDGRRIEKVEDGWLILNGEFYRKKVSEEMRKARLRKAQTTFRKKKKLAGDDNRPVSGKFLSGERRSNKAYGDGKVELSEEIAAENLPGSEHQI